MAFTYSVTGTGSNKVLTITSPDEVTISVSGGNVVLSQTGSADQTVGALSEFKVGGLPTQTVWNGVATANVVADRFALGSSDFFAKYNTGDILEANATGLTSGEWDVLSNNLGKLADESLLDLPLTAAQFDTVVGATQRLLDAKLSNVVGDIATVTAIAAASTDTFVIDASGYALASFNLVGSTNADTIYGGAGNDNIYNANGDTGADIIDGGAGNDSINGGAANDTITGGLGNDVITIGGGSDTITDLGAGSDVLVVTGTASAFATVTTDWTATSATKNSSTTGSVTLDLGNAVDVNLRAATETGGYVITAAGNTAASIITGSTNNDFITGSSLNDELRGAVGNDSIVGGDGVDAIFGGAGTNTLNGGLGVDTFTVNGSDLIQDLGQGADVLVVTSTGNVTSGVVTTSWTATSATKNEGAVKLDLNDGINVDLRAAGGAIGYTIDALNNTAASNIVGSNFADNITGSSKNDEIRGALGNDTIDGGSGSDVIYGGGGADVFQVTYGTDTIADLGTGTDVLIVSGGANAAGANAIVVSDWTATSSTQNNGTIRATLDLANGVDVNLQAVKGTAGYTITADGNNVASVITGATTADYITGSSLNDELRGYKGNDTIFGGSGDDAIYGGAGQNSINGGAGSDTFNLNGSTDTVADLGNGTDVLVVTGAATVVNATVTTDWTATAATKNTSEGTVTLNLQNNVDVNLRAATGDQGYTIATVAGNTAASIVTGSNFDDIISGSSKNDELRGAQGNDEITGGIGNDVLYGGAGNDTFNVDAGVDSIKDFGLGADNLVVTASATATVTVVSDWAASATTTNSGIANLNVDNGVDVDLRLATVNNGFTVSATNNALSSNITGSDGNDTVNGSVAADELRGAKGDDVIKGNGGADNIYGGAGSDTLTGGEGADTFFYVSGSTGVTETTGDRIEDFYSVLDQISTGVTGLTAADVTIADGTAQADFDAFKAAAEAAFATGKEVYVAYNQDNSGNALVAINNNGGVTFTSGDSLITLVGVNQASEITASNFIA